MGDYRGRDFSIVTSFSYDNANRMTGMTMPNGVASQYGFDAASRLSQILHQKNGQTLKSLGYVFDAADQITQISGMSSNTPEDSVVASAITNANNQYTAVDGQTVSHDANGNQVAQGPVSYQWDARNRLVGITGPGTTASFTYDALGRRSTRTTNGQTQAYQYDGANIIRDASAEYVQGPGIDNVLDRKEIATGNNEYYLKDHLGSTIALTDQSGNITTQYAYSPFGQVAKTGANSNNYFEYTGRENDGTGLYFYRARYYDPQQKRFIAEDPLEFGGRDTNLYGYVSGNPVSFADPSGNELTIPWPRSGSMSPWTVIPPLIWGILDAGPAGPAHEPSASNYPQRHGPLRSDIWRAPQGKQAVIPDWVAKRLGLNKREVGSAVENIKKREGLRGDDNVGLDLENGNVLHPKDVEEVIGNVHDENGDSKMNKRGRGKKNK